jgi:hypothetical protein
LFLPWIPHQRTRWQIKARKGKIDQLILEQKELVQKLDDTTESIRSLKKEIEILTKDNELSFQEIHRSGKKAVIDMESKEYASLEEEEHALVTRIEKLEKAVQKNSAKRVKDRCVYHESQCMQVLLCRFSIYYKQLTNIILC